jgi:hypothetical protein
MSLLVSVCIVYYFFAILATFLFQNSIVSEKKPSSIEIETLGWTPSWDWMLTQTKRRLKTPSLYQNLNSCLRHRVNSLSAELLVSIR